MKKSKSKEYKVTKDIQDLTNKKAAPPTMNKNKSDGAVKNLYSSSFNV